MTSGETPQWLTQAYESAPECGTVRVAGTDVSFRAWGPAGADGVVLVHGGAAHARWWDHVAPLLGVGRRVVALDLSGHGDSGRRPAYTLDHWASEVLAVAEAAGTAARPVVAGHSMGGFVAYAAAMRYGEALEGVITIDSPVRDLTPEEKAARGGEFRRLKVYPSKADAVARWRPVPAQDLPLPEVARYIAEHSVRESGDGWIWKFDPVVFDRSDGMPLGALRRLECRVAVFRSEFGLLSESMADAVYDRLGRLAPTIELAATGHAPMLDQPLSLVTGVRTLVADWQHSVSISAAEVPAP
jgi:pimeloyl-ACP methyl ester carboxylesterase